VEQLALWQSYRLGPGIGNHGNTVVDKSDHLGAITLAPHQLTAT
jgi:hypothetical protein